METSPAKTTTTSRGGNLRGAVRIFGGPTRSGIGIAAAATCGVLAAITDSADIASALSRWLLPCTIVVAVSVASLLLTYKATAATRPSTGGHLLAVRILLINGMLTVALILISVAAPAPADRIIGAAAISTSALVFHGLFATAYAIAAAASNAITKETAAATDPDDAQRLDTGGVERVRGEVGSDITD